MTDNAHAGAVAAQLAAVDDDDIPDWLARRANDEGEGDSEEGES